MTDIDLLLERWLTAFKKYGHTLEIFENPSKKEMVGIGKDQRFILDAKRKKCYIWSATGAIHSDAWVHIKKELNDARHVYKSGDLLTGVSDGSGMHIYAIAGLSQKVRQDLKNENWDFARRFYPDLDKLLKQLG